MLINLEPLAASAANKIVNTSLSKNAEATEVENIVTKSLGVLTEQGIYALGLFLATRKRNKDEHKRNDRKSDAIVADSIHLYLASLLKETYLFTDSLKNKQDVITDFYREITAPNENESSVDALRRILLIKQIFETTLTYARYAAKAAKQKLD